jgi:hypothetical protein
MQTGGPAYEPPKRFHENCHRPADACPAPNPTHWRTICRAKYRQSYRYLRFLALSNVFRVNSRQVDGDRMKMALYRRVKRPTQISRYIVAKQQFFRGPGP